MASTKKQEQVKSIQELIKNTPNFALIGFNKIKHQNFEELRKSVRKTSAKIKVVKNNLVKKALSKLTFEDKKYSAVIKQSKDIQNNTALLILDQDYSGALKSVLDYSKTDENISFKFGLLDGILYESQDLSKIAALPSKDQLLSKLLYIFKGPSSKLYYSLKSPMSKIINVLKSENLKPSKGEVSINEWRNKIISKIR